MSRLGIRARFAVALVALAVLAVGIATVLGDVGLGARLEDLARQRLERSAAHFAEVAAIVHAESGTWDRARPTLRHVAALEQLAAEVTVDGHVVVRTDPLTDVRAQAPLVEGSHRTGTITVSPVSGELQSRDERDLRASLDRVHLISGAIAVGAALVIAFLLAETLTRPLRRMRQTAERMESGALDARVAADGTTEVAALGRALNRLAQTLEHEEELRRATTADLAHELRTPVNALLTRIEAAQDGLVTGPENLEVMHGETLRLTRLLEDLARLGDAERPGMLLDKQMVDLAEVGRRVADSFAPRFAAKDVGLVVELTPVTVLGDTGRLEQITANLLENAYRYTDAGHVRLTVRRGGRGAVLEVADTGIGIAPEDLRHVFTRFWRGDRSRSRATGGTGIGLAIVQELVRAHDGRIDVESTPGQGSCFRIVLPASTP